MNGLIIKDRGRRNTKDSDAWRFLSVLRRCNSLSFGDLKILQPVRVRGVDRGRHFKRHGNYGFYAVVTFEDPSGL